ncbi:MAG: sarcosine oxidase subunit delta [Pseudomonadota bacterium]
MKINCPLCGLRDSREFSYKGAAVYANRPVPGAGDQAWDDYLHNRENPAGDTDELWHHGLGCGAWIIATRDTTTHVFRTTRLAKGETT